MDLQAIKTLKSDIPGNNRCVDCDQASKYSEIYIIETVPKKMRLARKDANNKKSTILLQIA